MYKNHNLIIWCLNLYINNYVGCINPTLDFLRRAKCDVRESTGKFVAGTCGPTKWGQNKEKCELSGPSEMDLLLGLKSLGPNVNKIIG